MQHDNPNERAVTTDSDERDVLGELIQAAGRRPTPSAEYYAQTFAPAHTAWRRQVSSRRRRQRVYAVAATLAVLAIGLSAVLRLMPEGSSPVIATAVVVVGDAAVFSPETGTWRPLDEPGIQIGPGSRLRTAADGRTAFRLTRDVSVRLNTDSELVFLSASELELIAGTVYVDSGPHNSIGSIEVVTSHGTIRDIGTQFEVQAVAGSLRVRVREGLVQLYQSGRLSEEGAAGEEFLIDSAGEIQRDRFSSYDPGWGWAEALAGPPNVDGLPVLEFLNWVARETGREIHYEEPGVQLAAGTAVLHGSAKNLTPMDALDAMLATTDFKYAVLTSGVIVISRPGVTR
ncbi:MAG: FecR domain-containing protein [Gammaproteobacteria bacterium]|nr:FecR domain-containing protein [Gammaproteobacteria bacterium]